MFKRSSSLRKIKASNPWALLTGWVWLCVLAMGGGLGLLLTLSAFGPTEGVTGPAAEAQSGLLVPSPAVPEPSPTSSVRVDPTIPPQAAPARAPAPTRRARAAQIAEPPGENQPLASLPFWEGPLKIGESVEGRPLEVYRFGSGPDRRMMVAGIHGGYEWNTVALADELINHLREHLEIIPPGVSLYILRVINPDGLDRGVGYEGRLNTNGVDLNRNYPSNWQVEWPNSGCWNHLPVSSGETPGSEPETQALMAFVREHPMTALISYHSAFLGIFPGGIPLTLPSVDLAQAVAEVTTYRYPPVETGCNYTGTLADWAANQGAAALDLELHTHDDTDFVENLAVLDVLLNWQPPVLTGR